MEEKFNFHRFKKLRKYFFFLHGICILCSHCKLHVSLQVPARRQVIESQWKSGQPQQQKLTSRTRQTRVHLREHYSYCSNHTGLHKLNRDSEQQKQPAESILISQISQVLQMSPNSACIWFPYVNKTEASQDKSEWNVSLHLKFFFS